MSVRLEEDSVLPAARALRARVAIVLQAIRYHVRVVNNKPEFILMVLSDTNARDLIVLSNHNRIRPESAFQLRQSFAVTAEVRVRLLELEK